MNELQDDLDKLLSTSVPWLSPAGVQLMREWRENTLAELAYEDLYSEHGNGD